MIDLNWFLFDHHLFRLNGLSCNETKGSLHRFDGPNGLLQCCAKNKLSKWRNVLVSFGSVLNTLILHLSHSGWQKVIHWGLQGVTLQIWLVSVVSRRGEPYTKTAEITKETRHRKQQGNAAVWVWHKTQHHTAYKQQTAHKQTARRQFVLVSHNVWCTQSILHTDISLCGDNSCCIVHTCPVQSLLCVLTYIISCTENTTHKALYTQTKQEQRNRFTQCSLCYPLLKSCWSVS